MRRIFVLTFCTLILDGILLGVTSHPGLAQQPPQPSTATEPTTAAFGESITLPDGSVAKLDNAAVPPELSVKERAERLPELAGRINTNQFLRQSIHAPVMIDIDPIMNADGDHRVAHRLHSAFIVYGPISRLRDEQLMQQLFGKGGTADEPMEEARPIPLEVLESLGIEPPEENEQYRYVTFPLLNEVRIQGTLHAIKQEGPDWIRLAWLLDPRFEQAGEYANRWSKAERNELGAVERTEPLPYGGLGGVTTVVVTDEAQNQLLIESRMVLHEPQAWFAGNNFLRAKLPLAIQENARNFRREFSAGK